MTDTTNSLAHFGKKGMRWGHRTAIIKEARGNVRGQITDLKQKRKQIKATDRPAIKARRQAEYDTMKASFLKNPDRVTASQMTVGGVAAAAILGGPVGLAVIGSRGLSTALIARDVKKRNTTSAELKVGSRDTKVTQRVKSDYNNMSDREFLGKYATTKSRYNKRVSKSATGDPSRTATKKHPRLAAKDAASTRPQAWK